MNKADPRAPKPASKETGAVQDWYLKNLPFEAEDYEDDFQDAQGHLKYPWEKQYVEADTADGNKRTVWDIRPYAYQQTEPEAPSTVNPSLWRQSRLNQTNGLFEVCPGIYQVRAFDMSNMTIIESEKGLVLIDPLISCECAADALQLYRDWRSSGPDADPEKAQRSVAGVIFTHSHVDHFGGVLGVIDQAASPAIIAPAGFMEHAVSENVYAGVAMSRRAQYMYGPYLEKGPMGQVDGGLGKGQSVGRVSIAAPTVSIERSGQTYVIDGVEIEFHMTPGAEAPAEFDFYFPQFKAFCAAENAVHTMHNIQTLRGAKVRDALVWSKYMNETLHRHGAKADFLFASHHWPLWGKDKIVRFLTRQRDMYRYLNDQTLRMLNKGYTGIEIAEVFEMPPDLANDWSCRGYYGSVNHNVKAVYDRYMGWFDGNPANLHPLPPAASSKKYVEVFGRDTMMKAAEAAHAAGEYRWAAELLNKLIYANKLDERAKLLQADVLEQLGYQAEAATWRNFYLMGAQELRHGKAVPEMTSSDPSMIAQMTLDMIFDALASHLHGPLIAAEVGTLTMNWIFSKDESHEEEVYLLELSNGALSTTEGLTRQDADVTVLLERSTLDNLASSMGDLESAIGPGDIRVLGAPEAIERFKKLFALVDHGVTNFSIVTPRPDATKGWSELTTEPVGPKPGGRKLRILGKLPRGC